MQPDTLYLDTEFTGLHQSARLDSLALVSGHGQAFYAEFTDFGPHLPTDPALRQWLEQNVLAHLLLGDQAAPYQGRDGGTWQVKGEAAWVTAHLRTYLAGFGAVEVWGDCPVWDWLLFCKLFDGALHIPLHLYLIWFYLAGHEKCLT